MRILIFGAAGMLGHKLTQVLGETAEVWGTVRGRADSVSGYGIFDLNCIIGEIDAGNELSIRRSIETVRPDVVINAVGIVKQLPSSKDVITTLTINSIFPHRLAQFAAEYEFRLFTISTDCVFDGAAGNYNESDRPNATDLYGKSKELGEVIADRCVTLRTSIIGRELGTSHSLVEWFLKNEGKRVNGFTKAFYSGFPTVILAYIIRDLIFNFPELDGLYHVSSDPIDKYELLRLLRKYYVSNIEIEPSDDVRIDRTLDSARFRSMTGFSPSSWEEMVEKMASDPTPYGKWK